MTPKEKAIELVEKYYQFEFDTLFVDTRRKYAKECALIAVNEIIMTNIDDWSHYQYWLDVKAEIESI